MKKTVLAVASILLAGSLVAFAGCDKGNNVGVIRSDGGGSRGSGKKHRAG